MSREQCLFLGDGCSRTMGVRAVAARARAPVGPVGAVVAGVAVVAVVAGVADHVAVSLHSPPRRFTHHTTTFPPLSSTTKGFGVITHFVVNEIATVAW